jgi:hypothetical protein
MAENIDNALLLQALEAVRHELKEQRALLLESIDQGRSLERYLDTRLLALNQRINELKDDVELTIKSELMGLLVDIEIRGGRG